MTCCIATKHSSLLYLSVEVFTFYFKSSSLVFILDYFYFNLGRCFWRLYLYFCWSKNFIYFV